jgi:hypothetical protein
MTFIVTTAETKDAITIIPITDKIIMSFLGVKKALKSVLPSDLILLLVFSHYFL